MSVGDELGDAAFALGQPGRAGADGGAAAFGTGPFREFHNLGTGRAATAGQPENHSVAPVGHYAEVVQSFFFGNDNQLWQVRPV